jgi:hypothetical protein
LLGVRLAAAAGPHAAGHSLRSLRHSMKLRRREHVPDRSSKQATTRAAARWRCSRYNSSEQASKPCGPECGR